MKIRNGFVSNSSSSSFLIYGTFLGNDLSFLFKNKEFKDYFIKDKDINSFDEYEDEDDSDVLEYLASFLNKKYNVKLEDYYIDYTGNYIGVSWDNIKDDQTGKQFKDSIENALKTVIPDVECSTYDETWYDG